ncbi:hypothetical protein F3Y22_tig00110561pilonHSYRG00013 [Hibiscus syriacus]|uniref:Trichome birefringence-like C-terminal domain-containing protein n=1 Tax=Hibiscus syriacus TaxID=106335 RepID=A0A6A3A6X2_HIBSY|nr:hypothetical protein F3Y22_tig00110561pilonHSYRG00013 [Hibiscus syriacus]
MPESIKNNGDDWKGVDYFNQLVRMRIVPCRPVEYDEIERPEAYQRVLKTWANRIEENVDSKFTSVYFMSMSPVHFKP